MTLSGSKALSDAWALFTGRFGPMLAVLAIFIVGAIALFAVFGASLMALMGTMMTGGGNPSALPGSGAFLSIFLFYLIMLALQFATQSALCRLCSDRHAPNIGDALGAGLRCVPTLFGVAILAFVGLFVFAFVFGIVGGLLGAAVMSGGQGGSVVGVLVVILVYGAMFWIFTRLAMVLPVVAIDEERNPIAAIARAWRMSKGSALKIFLVLALVFVVMAVVFMTLFMVFIGTPTPGNIPNFGALGVFGVLWLVLGALAGNYLVALVAAMHRQLAPTGTEAISEAFA